MGALTSKPYTFVSRPWELKSIESVDIIDSYLSPIRYDYRGTEVLRILPVVNNKLGSEWITDKTRFYYDAIQHQRLISPWVSGNVLIKFLKQYSNSYSFFYDKLCRVSCSWVFSLEVLNYNLQFYRTNYGLDLINLNCTSEGFNTVLTGMNMLNSSGSNNYLKTSFFNARSSYTSSLENLNISDTCFLINVNPRLELPILNLKLKLLAGNRKFEVFVFNNCVANFNFNVGFIGNSASTFQEFVIGKGLNSLKLLNSARVAFVFGISHLNSSKFNDIFLKVVVKNLKNLNISVGSLFIAPGLLINAEFGLRADLAVIQNKLDVLFYLVNYNKIELSTKSAGFNKIIMYAGSHGDISTEISDFIFPISMNTENEEIFLGLDFKLKFSKLVVNPLFNQIRSIKHLNSVLSYLFSTATDKNLKRQNFLNKIKMYLNAAVDDSVESYVTTNSHELTINQKINQTGRGAIKIPSATLKASQNLNLMDYTQSLNFKNFNLSNNGI